MAGLTVHGVEDLGAPETRVWGAADAAAQDRRLAAKEARGASWLSPADLDRADLAPFRSAALAALALIREDRRRSPGGDLHDRS